MPQHAAQVAAIGELLLASDWAYADFYSLQWLTPYWFGYVLVLLLSWPLGIVLALKLVLATALVAFPLAASALLRSLGGDGPWRWLLIPVPFGFAYHWGFLNFMVAVPIGLWALTVLVGLRGRSDLRACLWMAGWLHLLFVAHILTAAFICMVALLLLMSGSKGLGDWLRRCVPVFTILPITAAWLWSLWTADTAGGGVLWNLGIHRLTGFLPGLLSSPEPGVGQALGLLLLAAPWLLGARPGAGLLPWVPFLLYLLWMLTFPHFLGDTHFIYQRFGILGAPLYFLAFRRAPRGQSPAHAASLRLGIILVANALVAWQCIRTVTFDAEMVGYRTVIAQATPGKRMLMLAFDPTSRGSSAPVHLHSANWYQAEQRGLAEFSFSTFWGVPARFRQGAPTAIVQGFEWMPGSFDWQEHRGELYDYFLVRHQESAEAWLAERSNHRVNLVAREGDWQLYGRALAPGADGHQ